jgi:hypothetical protein
MKGFNTMALSNAERQRRHKANLNKKASELDALREEVATLREMLEDASATQSEAYLALLLENKRLKTTIRTLAAQVSEPPEYETLSDGMPFGLRSRIAKILSRESDDEMSQVYREFNAYKDTLKRRKR